MSKQVRIITLIILGLLMLSAAVIYSFQRNEIVNKEMNEFKPNHLEKVDAFLKEVDLDVANSFGISLDDLKKIDRRELIADQEKDYAKSLLKVQREIEESYGDIMPGVYVGTDGRKGYIFHKKADGTNYVYYLEYDNEWKIIKADKKSGTQMHHNNEQIKHVKYSPLTTDQVNNFTKENGITPLAVKNVGNSTVVLYETNTERGAYTLFVDENGKINHGKGAGSNNSQITPVSIGSQGSNGAEGKMGFAEIVINNDDIRRNARTIRVIFKDKTEVTEPANDVKGYIIPSPNGESQIDKVFILDDAGNILFKHE